MTLYPCVQEEDLKESFERASSEALSAFGNGTLCY